MYRFFFFSTELVILFGKTSVYQIKSDHDVTTLDPNINNVAAELRAIVENLHWCGFPASADPLKKNRVKFGRQRFSQIG